MSEVREATRKRRFPMARPDQITMICAGCGRERTPAGEYVERTSTRSEPHPFLSHGLCVDCLRKLLEAE